MNPMTTKRLARKVKRKTTLGKAYKKSRYNEQGSHIGKAQAARYAARKESNTKGESSSDMISKDVQA